MIFEELKQLFPNATKETWHQHSNPDGTIGGWVENTAYVAPTVYVGPEVLVYGNTRVCGNARMYGKARVYGDAQLTN